jgi:hypothetical protein
MSNNMDEKAVRVPSEDEKSGAPAEYHDTAVGYGAMPDDPDVGLSAEERAAIVCVGGSF